MQKTESRAIAGNGYNRSQNAKINDALRKSNLLVEGHLSINDALGAFGSAKQLHAIIGHNVSSVKISNPVVKSSKIIWYDLDQFAHALIEKEPLLAKKAYEIVSVYGGNAELEAAAIMCLKKTRSEPEFIGEFRRNFPSLLQSLHRTFNSHTPGALIKIASVKKREQDEIFPKPRAQRWELIAMEVRDVCASMRKVSWLELGWSLKEIGFQEIQGNSEIPAGWTKAYKGKNGQKIEAFVFQKVPYEINLRQRDETSLGKNEKADIKAARDFCRKHTPSIDVFRENLAERLRP